MTFKWKPALAAYALIGVVTFGHAASRHAPRCIARDERHQCISLDTTFVPAMSGLLAAEFWPLYWSWEVFSWLPRP